MGSNDIAAAAAQVATGELEARLEAELRTLEQGHPEWFQEFQDVDPFVANRADVERLLASGPNDFARGLLTGIHMFRNQLAAVTQRDY